MGLERYIEMSSVIFELETLNPNYRTTYFKIKNYTEYIAKSEYAIRNPNTTHGLFGKVERFSNIQDNENIEPIKEYIDNLAKNKIPIFRGLLSLKDLDASRLGYFEQDKWKNLLESKLPSIAEKLNIKYEDIQYVGAVHIERGHPHFQFMIWSKGNDIKNYFVHYKLKNELRKEFINAVFREDLLPIYEEKEQAKKNITSENYILQELRKVITDPKLRNDLLKYEKDYNQTRRIRALLKDSEIKHIVDLLIDLKKELKQTTGSIKYQYLKKYPDIINKVDNISNVIIDSSVQCKIEIEKYIKAKQKLEEFKYTNKEKMEQAMAKAKEEAQEEVIKLIGNQILDIERKWLNANEPYTYIKYNNDSRDLMDRILTALYFQAENQRKLNRNYEVKYKKQLSRQAKKELAISKRNASSFEWEDDI